MQSIKVHSVTGDVRPVNAISVWDASSTGKRPVDSIPVWDDTNEGDKPLNAIQVKLVGDEPSAIKVWFKDSEGPGPGPVLPAKTVRFDFKYDHFDPTTLTDYGGIGATWTHVEDDVYDFYYNNTDWGARYWDNLHSSGNLFRTYSSTGADTPFRTHNFDIIDANLEGVTNVEQLFGGTAFAGLQSILSIRNTSSVTNFKGFLSMGSRNATYTSIPLFDTSSAVDVRDMCKNARNVTTGALALYNQMSTQANPPTNTTGCFTNCGSNTETGLADLAFIPTSWGGNFSGFNEVTIGDVTWADSNVAIDDGEGGIITQELHDVNGVDLGTQYYYTYEAAQRIANKFVGWKLPAADEAFRLYQLDVKSLMSTTAWTYHNGNNHTGLNMKPVGYCNPTLENTGTYSTFWFVDYAPGAIGGVTIIDEQYGTYLINARYNYMPIRLVKEQNS